MLFFRGVRPAQHFISVRKAAKTFDQLHMGFCVFRAHFRLREQIEAAALYLNVFAVLVWQIEENLVGFLKLLIPAFLNGHLGDRERFRIVSEGRGAAAVEIREN